MRTTASPISEDHGHAGERIGGAKNVLAGPIPFGAGALQVRTTLETMDFMDAMHSLDSQVLGVSRPGSDL